MPLLLHEWLGDSESDQPVELFAARCDHNDQAALLRQWIGGDYRPDPHGKPTASDRSISLSHTSTYLALAIRTRGRVGVDVETIPPAADILPCPQGLSTAEQQLLMALIPGDRPACFCRLWTAKEALSKAFGLGVSMDLSQIELRPDAQGMAFISLYGKPQLAQGWTLAHRQLQAPPAAIIAVAWNPLLKHP